MKKIITLSLCLAASTITFAQRNINLKAQITAPTSTPTIVPSVAASFTYVFTNVSGITLGPTDSIFYQDLGLASNSQVGFTTNKTVAPGDTVMRTISWTFTGAPNGNVQWCLVAQATNRSNPITETDTSDNRSCITVNFQGFPNSIENVFKVDDNISTKLGISPNPSTSNINFDFVAINNSEVTLVIRDVTGRMVATQNFGNAYNGKTNYNYNASNLTSGLYIVEISQDGIKSVGKFHKL